MVTSGLAMLIGAVLGVTGCGAAGPAVQAPALREQPVRVVAPAVLTIVSTDVVATDGDSRFTDATVGDAANLPRCWVPIKAACDAAFAGHGDGTPSPVRWVNWAQDGSTTAACLGRLAANLAVKPTKIILYVGINDVRLGVLPRTIAANISAYLRTAFAAGVLQVMVIGPDFSGERWSPGDAGNPNTYDAAIKATLAPEQLPAAVGAFSNAVWFDNRANFFMKYEPTYNAPAPGAPGGVLTVDPIGLHQNALGRSLQSTEWLKVIRFAR